MKHLPNIVIKVKNSTGEKEQVKESTNQLYILENV